MKHYHFIIIFVCSFTLSCKKDDYRCRCEVRYTIESQVNNPNHGTKKTIDVTYRSVSKRTAKKNCLTVAANYSDTQGYVIQNCVLQ